MISSNFFENPDWYQRLWHKEPVTPTSIEHLTSFTAQDNFLEHVDVGWAGDYPEWMKLYQIGMRYKQHIFDNYDVDPNSFHDWWGKIHEDVWDRENYPTMARENSDIHIDTFPGFSKIINLQIYMSHDIPPEAGTCFWKYQGTDETNHDGPWSQEVEDWRLIEQLPFDYNTAFSYDAGPGGEFHSAPLTNDLLERGVPNHTRRVIIMRYRFK